MSNIDPLVPNLPSATRALARKYANPATLSLLGTAPTPIQAAIRDLDQQRVTRGQSPLNERETQLGLAAATTGQAVTQTPDDSPFDFVGNVLGNVKDMATSLHRIPGGMIREVRDLPAALSSIPRVARESANPLRAVGNIAALPGVRMLPGAYIAEELLSEGGGGVQELMRNPVFTALDVTPVTGSIARRTAVGRAVIDQGKRAGTLTPLMRRLDEFGEIQPRALGSITDAAVDAIKPTRVGQLGMAAFSKDARATTRVEAQLTSRLRDIVNPEAKVVNPDIIEKRVMGSRTMSERFDKAGVNLERQTELLDAMKHAPEMLDDLADMELAFVNEFTDTANFYKQLGLDEGSIREVAGEVYDKRTADLITKAEKQSALRASRVDARTAVLDGGRSADDLLSSVQSTMQRTGFPRAENVRIAEGYILALVNDGHLTGADLKAWRRAVRNKTEDEFLRTLRPTATPRHVTDIIGETLAHLRSPDVRGRIGRSTRVYAYQEAINLGHFAAAADHLNKMRSTKMYRELVPNIDEAVDALRAQTEVSKYLERTESFTAEYAAKAAKRVEYVKDRAVPSRYIPEVQRRIDEKVTSVIREKYATDPNLEQYLEYARERNYAFIEGFGEKAFREIQRDIALTWREMRDAGFNPRFVHKVTPGQAATLQYPRASMFLKTPSQVKRRTLDWSASTDNASAILTHQGVEWLQRRATEDFIREIDEAFGRDKTTLLAGYTDRVRGMVPEEMVREEAMRAMSKEWVPLDAGAYITWPAPKLGGLFSEERWVPRHVSRVIDGIHTPPGERILAPLDPAMNVFRTSLLPLSPRWHVYNILSGGFLVGLRTGPGVVTKIGDAIRLMKGEGLPAGAPPSGVISAPMDFAEASMRSRGGVERWLKTASESERFGAAFRGMGGQKLRELWDSLGPMRTKAGKVVDRSYWLNQWFDDLYRSMAYLYDYDKSITKGMTKADAQAAGIAKVRKVMQSWDEITPLERTIMRGVFPFYGWMQHAARYVFTYPADHPIRAAFITQFAQNEVADWQTGLPERFRSMFFWGGDDEGNVNAFSFLGANPFSDVADYFTMEGFTSNAAPYITLALESLGVDTGRGGPQLYPDLKYDRETGTLVADTPSIMSQVGSAFVPQLRALDIMVGRSNEFKQLAYRDPNAARRMMLSSVGIPILHRQINVPQEIIKAELARDREQRDALRNALKTGDLDSARRFPQLRAYVDQIAKISGEGGLDQFRPDPEVIASYGAGAAVDQARTIQPGTFPNLP